jgi:hypothetical protein
MEPERGQMWVDWARIVVIEVFAVAARTVTENMEGEEKTQTPR